MTLLEEAIKYFNRTKPDNCIKLADGVYKVGDFQYVPEQQLIFMYEFCLKWKKAEEDFIWGDISNYKS